MRYNRVGRLMHAGLRSVLGLVVGYLGDTIRCSLEDWHMMQQREQAVALARALRARGITSEWRITVSQMASGNWRVIISEPDGGQALALYNGRILDKPVQLNYKVPEHASK